MHVFHVLFAAAAILLAGDNGAASQSGGAAQSPADKVIAGWIENAWIGDPPIRIEAKLDTGADNSSLNAKSYREFKKGGQAYLAFQVTSKEGRTIDIEAPVVRTASVKRAGAGTVARPVIMLKVCVAGVTSNVEFNLSDRSALTYQMLIGRTFLADKILVASDRTFLKTGLCKN